MHADYEVRRGGRYRPPANEPLYIGRIPASAQRHLDKSLRLARERGV
jgi:hypothetical protein